MNRATAKHYLSSVCVLYAMSTGSYHSRCVYVRYLSGSHHRNGAFLTLLLFLQCTFLSYKFCLRVRSSGGAAIYAVILPKRAPLFLFIGFCRATTFKSCWRKMSFNSISQLKRLFQGGHHPKNCRHDLLFMQSCQAKAFRQSRGIFKGCTISAWFPLSVGGW